MSWLQLTYYIDHSALNQIEELLNEQGALSITLLDAEDQPVLEPEPGTTPLWDKIQIKALFAYQDGESWKKRGQAIHAGVQRGHTKGQQALNQALASLASPVMELLENEDWQRRCMQDFKPISMGSRLWIVPSWHDTPATAEVPIYLDPGLAFGTGTHETTALCLQWLDSHINKPVSVIDYGCGSGILGIAALALGASRVTGVDIDPQALEASQDNAQKNKVQTQTNFYLPENIDGFLSSNPADMLIANILTQPLIKLAALFATFVKPGGQLLLSGLLSRQTEHIMLAYTQWFDQFQITQMGGWSAISAQRKPE